MEAECSLPYLRQPATDPYPESDAKSRTHFPFPLSFQRVREIPKTFVTFRNKLVFYGKEL